MGLAIFCVVILIINIILWVFCFKVFRKSFSAKGVLTEIRQEAEKIIIEIKEKTFNLIKSIKNDIPLYGLEKRLDITLSNLFAKPIKKDISKKEENYKSKDKIKSKKISKNKNNKH